MFGKLMTDLGGDKFDDDIEKIARDTSYVDKVLYVDA
jgi:hypothetical protein